MSWRLRGLDLWLRLVEKPYLSRARSPSAARARMERQAALFRIPPGAKFIEQPAGNVPTLRLPPRPGAGLLLWFHGGAYCVGSPRTHAAMVAALALRAGLGAVLPAYRLAPENPFPAAPDDALAVYRALLAEGYPPDRIHLGGDSSGGGLALALVHMLLAEGLPPPASAVLFCPWVDLTLSGASLRRLARRDALLPAHRLVEVRDGYLAGADPRDPRASPLFGEFRGGPPVMLQASRAEILLDDALMMAARLKSDGVAVTVDIREDVPHVWQMFWATLPEAGAALDAAAGFLAERATRWPS